VALLEVRNVTRRFGGVVALDDVSFDVEGGHIAGLIGPNGAGKTTAFNVITRIYRPDAGQVVFDGTNLLRTPPHKIVKRGIARTFQNVELFGGMSVLDNVLVGTHARTGWFGERRARRRALRALEEVGAAEFAHRPAAALPFGILKRVELARALAAEPRLLLLDEPAGGLDHEEVGALGELIRRLRKERDLTILLVEHHMNLVMSVSERVHVLDFGRTIAAGTPEEIRRNPDVIEAYLGEAPK
jgi:branched-chain amino acid transport system ATP-binding protein